MSEWDFLWDLKGQELLDAQSCGCTYDDLLYIYKQNIGEQKETARNSLLEMPPIETSLFTNNRPSLAVFVDAENIPPKCYPEIQCILADLGSKACVRVYAMQKDACTKGWHVVSKNNKEVKEIRLCGGSEKNKVDRKIIKDVTKSCDTHLRMDQLVVIVTSDADFAEAAQHWHDLGLFVVGIGEKKTPQKLRDSYAKFVELGKI